MAQKGNQPRGFLLDLSRQHRIELFGEALSQDGFFFGQGGLHLSILANPGGVCPVRRIELLRRIDGPVVFPLEYYDRIFSRHGPEFWELVKALEDQLESYAGDLTAAVAGRDATVLSRLRHSHRPAVINLRLTRLRALETEIADAIGQNAPKPQLDALVGRFTAEVRNVALSLAEIRQAE